MYSLLLVIIYIAFVSLGLPDSLLGAAWPVMHADLGVSVSFAGIISMIIAGGTIVSSLLSDRVTRRFGAGVVTAFSVLMTAVALLGFSMSHSVLALCLWSIPYGVGAGAVDATLNNYVALHYAARHMSWLHCFWGVGAVLSPYIMGFCLTGGYGWDSGYFVVFVIQIVLTAILFFTLPLWKRKNAIATDEKPSAKALSLSAALRIRGVPMVLGTFFAYCALEQIAGLWASTYLVEMRSVGTDAAALFSSFFFLGITLGRLLCGFIADRVGDVRLIRAGIWVTIAAAALILLPVRSNIPALSGLIVIGLGCAPIYPAVIHATPARFGQEHSQAIIGIQMASAYFGTTFMPPLFGWFFSYTSIGLFPASLLFFAILMLFLSERLNKMVG